METKSGYILERIGLMKSNFMRTPMVKTRKEIKESLDISFTYNDTTESDTFNIGLRVTYIQADSDNKINQVSAEIEFVAAFKEVGAPQLVRKKFSAVNGPAIIFPFVREHLATLALKAGLPPILLHPVNFVALEQEPKT